MLTRLPKIISWLFTAGIVILGIVVVYLFYHAEPSKAMVVIPTISPFEASTNPNYNLPPYRSLSETDSIVRLAQLHTYRPEQPRFKVFQYTVEKGDSAWTIAKKFDIEPETILWGNEGLSTEAGTLKIGAVLNILPVDGVLHTVKNGIAYL